MATYNCFLIFINAKSTERLVLWSWLIIHLALYTSNDTTQRLARVCTIIVIKHTRNDLQRFQSLQTFTTLMPTVCKLIENLELS